MTEAEYLALDAASERKWEFYADPRPPGTPPSQVWGEAVALNGVNHRHSRIATDAIGVLGAKLKGTGCEFNGPDLRVGREDDSTYNYPDLSVVCGPPEFREDHDDLTLVNPVALFEVVSPSSEPRDRGEKVRRYTKIASVRLYVVLEQARVEATVLRRNGDGASWLMTTLEGPEATVDLDPPGVSVTLGELYEGVGLQEVG